MHDDLISVSSYRSLQRHESAGCAVEDDQFIFLGGAFNIPKNQKGPSEDAYFMNEKGVGVSDGVGGWNSYGIDSSRFSTTLMKQC